MNKIGIFASVRLQVRQCVWLSLGRIHFPPTIPTAEGDAYKGFWLLFPAHDQVPLFKLFLLSRRTHTHTNKRHESNNVPVFCS